MKIIEKWGTGIPRIFRECKEYGLPDPKVIDFDGDVRVNMYRKVELYDHEKVNDRVNEKVNDKVTEKVTKKVTEKEQEILDLLSENAELTLRIKSLKEKNRLEHIGSARKGYWKIKQ